MQQPPFSMTLTKAVAAKTYQSNKKQGVMSSKIPLSKGS